jgi:3-phosphoshikimate 1-carboxyvinyltransferase
MLLPVSLLSPHPTTWTGEARLIDRSLKSLARLCHTHGLRFQHHDPHHQLPLAVQGPLQPGDYVIDSTETSQFISGLLMVLPLLHGASTLTLQGTRVSSPYIHMTVAMMKQWGVTVSEKSSTFYIPGNQHYVPQIVTAEPDASHAAFFLCGGTLQGKITLRGRFDHAHQGDVILIEQLRNHGASIIDTEAGYVVQSSALQPFDWQLADVPDLAPMLILTSAFIDGVSNFAALSRLNDKESLRFDHIQTYLRLWNIPFTATADTIRVVGSSLHRIPEGRYPTYHDHRFAMALAMLSPQAASSYVIEGVECINKSYPTFLSDYTTLQGQWMKEEVQ